MLEGVLMTNHTFPLALLKCIQRVHFKVTNNHHYSTHPPGDDNSDNMKLPALYPTFNRTIRSGTGSKVIEVVGL